jgi:hypothetical protein
VSLSTNGDKLPAWVKCPCCDDFICTIHNCHTADCPCPEIDFLDFDPYTTKPENASTPGRQTTNGGPVNPV